MISFLKQNKIIILLIVLALVLLGYFLYLRLALKNIKILAFSPQNKTVNIGVNEKIGLSLSQGINPQNLYLKSQPPIMFKLLPASSIQEFSFIHDQPFETNTLYNLTLYYKNQTVLSWSFKTENLQSDPSIFYKIEQENKKNYPLFDYLPYHGSSFDIAYIKPLHLTVKVWDPDKQNAEKEVLEFIKTKGVDPQTHKIDWVTNP